jgi:hypothetical protein
MTSAKQGSDKKDREASMMKPHFAWATEELLNQAQRNFSGHLALIFVYLQQKELSVDEFIKFTGEKTSKRWKSVITDAGDLMNAVLLNVLANGEKVIKSNIDKNWASATVTGLFRKDVMEYYDCPPDVYERFWDKFKLIADAAGFSFSWKKDEKGCYEIEVGR